MITQHRNSLILAISLAGLAGFVDALGFLKLGGFFVSFMSGNSTRLAVGLSEHGLVSLTVIPLALITLFVLGVMLGTLVRHWFPDRHVRAVLGFVTLMLLLAAVCASPGFDAPAVICMVIAMGAENNIFIRNGQVDIGLTYMTGTLVKLGQKLAGGFLGKPKRDCLPYLFLWAGLVSGAVLGAFSYAAIGLASLWIAAGFAGLVLAVVTTRGLFQ